MLDVKKLIDKVLLSIRRVLIVQTFNYTKFTYNSGYTYYTTAGVNMPMAQRCGRVVTLVGAFKNTSAQSSAAVATIGKVPAGCEPLNTVSFVQQGSGTNRLFLTIESNGNIKIDRYGITSHIAIPANSWLNIGCTYICNKWF